MSEERRQVTDPSAFQHRSLGKQVLFTVITLGVYVLYWYYVTLKQFNEGTDADYNPTVRFVLGLVPLVNLWVIWEFSKDAEAVVDQDAIVIFVADLLFAPIVWYLVQTEINEITEEAPA